MPIHRRPLGDTARHLLFKSESRAIESGDRLALSPSEGLENDRSERLEAYLEREGKADAPLFGTFADVCWRVGLQRQDRFDELRQLDGEVADPDVTRDELVIGDEMFDWRALVLSQMDGYTGTGTIKALCTAVANGFRVVAANAVTKMSRGTSRATLFSASISHPTVWVLLLGPVMTPPHPAPHPESCSEPGVRVSSPRCAALDRPQPLPRLRP